MNTWCQLGREKNWAHSFHVFPISFFLSANDFSSSSSSTTTNKTRRFLGQIKWAVKEEKTSPPSSPPEIWCPLIAGKEKKAMLRSGPCSVVALPQLLPNICIFKWAECVRERERESKKKLNPWTAISFFSVVGWQAVKDNSSSWSHLLLLRQIKQNKKRDENSGATEKEEEEKSQTSRQQTHAHTFWNGESLH